MSSVIRFLNAGNMKPADIYRKLCELYKEHAMSDLVVQRWVRHFIKGRENVHDDPRSGQPPVVNEDLVRAVEEKIPEKDDSPFRHVHCAQCFGAENTLCLWNSYLKAQQSMQVSIATH
jgi:transposase